MIASQPYPPPAQKTGLRPLHPAPVPEENPLPQEDPELLEEKPIDDEADESPGGVFRKP